MTIPNRLLAIAVVLSVAARPTGAQAGAQAGAQIGARAGAIATPGAVAATWPAPLDRRVAMRLRDVSLREALDRVAAAARLHLSYSAELLPLERSVRASWDSVPAGEALGELLRGTAVEPVVLGGAGDRDQVVLAPARGGPSRDAVAASLASRPRVLERVVVTGSAMGAPQRSLPIAIDVVSGRQLAERTASVGTLSQALDAAVPGLWIWEQSPASPLARYGSIRGASSFGLSYPKVYIDGIEVANPLLVAQFNPESIERIEVIRGPQGAALYGADAISGVVNITTRHEGVDAGAPRARVRSTAGVSQSDFASHAVLVQEHSLALRAGSNLRSVGLALAAGTLGDYYPRASSEHVLATGGLRLIGTRASLVATARGSVARAGASTSPILADSVRATTLVPPSRTTASADTTPQSVREYTLGATAKLMRGGRWTHALVLGVDGYRLDNVARSTTPLPSATDSALQAARGSADRATVRASSVAQLGAVERASATLTVALEHAVLHAATRVGGTPTAPGRAATPSSIENEWLRNTGIVGQADVGLRNTAFLSGGLRLERNDGFAVSDERRDALLPMLGGALVRDAGLVTLKLRGAYGKGIRPPKTATRSTTGNGPLHLPATLGGLRPEEQAGVEAGVDLLVGGALTVQLTRFDQRASGLIQQVAVVDSTTHGGAGPQFRRIRHELQNVGEITNRGWEMLGSAQHGPLSVVGTLSLVDSRVRRRARGYTGDLRPGDRMLEVPGRTLSLATTWTESRWSSTVTLARATDWINYDRLTLARAYAAADRRSRDFVGAQLRRYWRTYDGITRLQFVATREIRSGLGLMLTGVNLLDRQRGEPDDVTVLPGRTITAGVRAAF